MRQATRSKLASGVTVPLLTTAGSAALKWSITYAGQESAMDVELAVHNARYITHSLAQKRACSVPQLR